MGEYDKENIFAKILDGKAPSHKIYESRSSLAILDAFPVCEGHVLVLPKQKNSTSILDMHPKAASDFMSDVQHVAKAVKEALGCEAVNIASNCGAAAGQTVFHPHFHIIPRFKDDKTDFKFPPSKKDQVTAEEVAPTLEKLKAALNPPQKLKKATFQKIGKIDPRSKGLNLKVKVISEPQLDDKDNRRGSPLYEAHVGDASGSVKLLLKEDQKSLVTKDAVLELRNAFAKCDKGHPHIRLVIDKWGKIEKSNEEFDGTVDESEKKNISAVEYELVEN